MGLFQQLGPQPSASTGRIGPSNIFTNTQQRQAQNWANNVQNPVWAGQITPQQPAQPQAPQYDPTAGAQQFSGGIQGMNNFQGGQRVGGGLGGGMGMVNGRMMAIPGMGGASAPNVPTYGNFNPSAQPQQPGIGSITTSVQPAGVYTPQMTQQAVNQARASADQQADPRWQQKQFMTPGRAMDSGTLGAAMPGIANSLFQGQQQAAMIPLQDAFANQQQLQQGQIGQQQEATGLANALSQFNENNIYQQNALLNPLLGLLGQGMF